MADLCWICNHPPHPPTAHVYTTLAEAKAWYDKQPSEPPGGTERRYVEQWRPE